MVEKRKLSGKNGERSKWFAVEKSGGISSGTSRRKAVLGSNERNKGGARAKLIIDKTINLCQSREKADPIGSWLFANLSSFCFSRLSGVIVFS